jgi:uncharacterized phage protein (predicted DNA packaging)
MAIVTLDEAKQWLRVDTNDDDVLIQSLIASSEQYLKEATGVTYDNKNELAKLFCLTLISDWYENREMVGKASDVIRYTVNSLLMQLTYGSGAVGSDPP